MRGILTRPIDIAPLVYFRIVGGALMTIETVGQLLTDYRGAYVGADVHFHYYLLPWLVPWPPLGVYLHFGVNILAGTLLTLGLYTRASALVFGVGTLSLFLMEQAVYINHTYLYALTGLLLAATPCGGGASLDVRRRAVSPQSSAPAWCLWVLRFQLALVYVYGGIAKLDADWLAGLPLRVWLARLTDYPLVGPLFALDGLPLLVAWGGLAFDLLVVPGLLWRRTRALAFAAAIVFHLSNVVMFGLATFPWFALAMTALFFEPAAFRRIGPLRRALERPVATCAACATCATCATEPSGALRAGGTPLPRVLAAALVAYCLIQLLLPLRVHLYPGRASWTEQGHTFAWRMMLRTKSGGVVYEVRDPVSGRTWREHPMRHLTPRQYRNMFGKPELIRQFAHYLAREYEKRGWPNVEVRARTMSSLNGRRHRRLVRADVDLAAEPASLAPYDWILPAPP